MGHSFGILRRLCYRLWLFHLHSAVEMQPFFPFSPWRDIRLRHFPGYPFGASRKKASTIFITQPLRKSQPFSMTQPFYYGRVSGIFGDATVNVCCLLS